MNDIEQRFFDAFVECVEPIYISTQVPIGIYIADFVVCGFNPIPCIVEIDGHEFHKTKEQRFSDYKRERYFMSEGYFVIRFMGSEVFVNAKKCAEEAIRITWSVNQKCTDEWLLGCNFGEEQGRREATTCQKKSAIIG